MIFEIRYKKKLYKISREYLVEILSRTINIKINKDTKNGKIYSLMKKSKLINDIFLNSVS